MVSIIGLVILVLVASGMCSMVEAAILSLPQAQKPQLFEKIHQPLPKIIFL